MAEQHDHRDAASAPAPQHGRLSEHGSERAGPVRATNGDSPRIVTLDALWDRYGRRMVDEAMDRLGEFDAAQAACLHALVRASEHLREPIDGGADLWPWLRRITEAVCDEVIAGRVERGVAPSNLEQIRRQLIHEALEHDHGVAGNGVSAVLWRARQRMRARMRGGLGEFPVVAAIGSLTRRITRHAERLNSPTISSPTAGVTGYLTSHPLLVEAAAAFTAVVSLAGPSTGPGPAEADPIAAPVVATTASVETPRGEPLMRMAPSEQPAEPEPAPEPQAGVGPISPPPPPPSDPKPLPAPSNPRAEVGADTQKIAKEPVEERPRNDGEDITFELVDVYVDADDDGDPEIVEQSPEVNVYCSAPKERGPVTGVACPILTDGDA